MVGFEIFKYKFLFVLVIIVSLFSILLPLSNSQEISSLWIGGVEVFCDEEGPCLADFDPLRRPCDPFQGVCPVQQEFIDGCALCGGIMCGDGVNNYDGVCPSDFDPFNRFCYSIDNDCNQCMIYETDIFASGLVVGGDSVNLSSSVHGDDCIDPKYLKLELIPHLGSTLTYCRLYLTWNEENLQHDYINAPVNAQGIVDGLSTIGLRSIPEQCSNKEVCVSSDSKNAPFFFESKLGNEKRLNSNSEGCINIGEINYPSECSIVVTGKVIDENQNNLSNVGVTLRNNDSGINLVNRTNSNGVYYIHHIFDQNDSPFNDFEIIFSKDAYESHINKSFEFSCDSPSITYNVTLYPLTGALSLCQSDCTMLGSNICDSRCEGINDCKFNSSDIRNACDPYPDNPYGGSLMGHQIDLDGELITCCIGGKSLSSISAEVIVPEDSKNVVKTTRIVFLKGQPVKMNVVVYD